MHIVGRRRAVHAGLRPDPRRVEEARARDADRARDAAPADRDVRAPDADRQARSRAREVHGDAGEEADAAVEAKAHLDP